MIVSTEGNFAMIRLGVVQHLEEIKNLCSSWGLDGIDKFTLIARDPEKESMILVVTNEDDMTAAFEAALKKTSQV